ncbi:MAG: hypothetical protein IJU47_04430 [Verrucomicrobia bacterium]|nr:hypothetical protein [Verrucomicrobiota bacterium]
MKKISLIIAVITACGAFAVTDLQAQQANRQQRRAPQMVMPSAMSSEQRVKMLTDSLKLTEEQQTKLKAVFDEQAAALKELNGKDRSERQEAMQKLRTEQEEKIKEILTEDQYKTYTSNMTRSGRGQGGPGQGGPQALTLDQRVDRIAKALELDDEVKAKLKTCLEENEKAMTELRQKSQSMSRNERAEAMQKLRTEQETKLKEVLGEDLYKKYQEQSRNFVPGNNFQQRMTPAQQAEDIAKKLELTDDQKTKLTAFYEEQQKSMQEMFTKMQGLTNDERREAMQKNRTESEAKLKEILGEDLYKKYQEEMRSRGPGMMNGPRMGGQGRPGQRGGNGNPGNRPQRRGGGNQ